MLRSTPFLLVSVAALLAACGDSSKITSPPRLAQPDAPASFSQGVNGQAVAHAERVCPGSPIGEAHCHAWVVTDGNGNPLATSSPSGYGPSDLRSAYGLAAASANNGAGATIAIVDAFDDPYAEKDLGTYRAQFGLTACTTANGCFKKVNQNGAQSSYPRANASWSQEISLDLDMASAVCPKCHILLVEASSASLSNLAAAVDRAAAMGATAISNSYGGSEYSSEVNDQSHYNHPGIAITVSSGDNGFGVEFPAASQYVTAVGGTSLRRSTTTSRGWTESVWSGAGSGCSAYVAQQSWQTSLGLAGCGHRMVADVSAIADPNTGVAVYDSYAYRGASGWLVFGGTSVASPIVASVYALSGNVPSIVYGSYPYANTSSLFDVSSGSNGSCGTFLCTGTAGFDGPTGLGTPNGVSAF